MALDNPTAAIATAFPGRTFKEGDVVTVGPDQYAYNKDGNFEASGESADGVSKSTTPPSWDGFNDARENKGAGKYPNYYAHKTRSGHVLLMDDSKGAEHVTLQHRSGSMVQFHPDGKVAITAQNGQYTFTFGENRVKITGAYDITVDGAASMKVDGDYNLTVGKNMNIAVKGDLNVNAKNFYQKMIGNIDIAAKNMTTKLEGSNAVTAKGSMALSSKGGFMAGSVNDSASIVAKNQLALLADTGEMMIRSGQKLSMEAVTGDIVIQTLTGKFSAKGLTSYITGSTFLAMKSSGAVDITSTGLMQVKAGGALLMGATAAIGITGGAAVGISAVGEVGIDAGAAVGIAAVGAVGVESASIGLNASLIASLGIIEQNGPVVVAVPPTPPAPVIPIVWLAPDPTNPKLEFTVGSAETADTVDV